MESGWFVGALPSTGKQNNGNRKVYDMLQIYHPQQGWQKAPAVLPAQGWLKLINPNKEELHRVSQQYRIALDLLQSGLDPAERPRIDSKDQAHLVVTHVPRAQEAEERAPFATMPMGIITKNNVVITVCTKDNPVLHMAEAHYPSLTTESTTEFVYRLLATGTQSFFEALKTVENKVSIVEQELQRSIKNRQVFKLLNQNQSLIAFAHSLQSKAQMVHSLRTQALLANTAETENVLLDVQVATEQAHAIAATHSANLRNLMDAYSAAIENNLSLVVQYLSIYVIIMAVPMGIAGIYGMNTPLPFQDEPYILALLGLIGFVVACLMTRAFKARRII